MEKILKYLEKYLAIASPTGYTHRAIDELTLDFDRLGLDYYKNNKGGLISSLEGKNNEKAICISAHVDTLGAMVKNIESDGTIRYNKIGGGAWSAVEGENCNILTRSGKSFRGSFIPDMAATHIFGQAKGNSERSYENMAIRLDERVSRKDDLLALGINIGDFVSIEPRLEITESGFIKSRYLDNKLQLAIMLAVIEKIQAEGLRPSYRTYFYISNFEESGHGISHMPEEVFEFAALDIGIVGRDQNSDEYSVSIACKDRKTPYNYLSRERLTGLAEKHGIDYRLDLYNFYSTDSSQAIIQGKDLDILSFGPGVNSAHHYERSHMDGVKNTFDLLYRYILER